MEDSQKPKPKRRVRYKGTHPKHFHEKYKELNPESYTKDVQKIIERGATPVGTHRPICVDEIIKILNPQDGDIAIDATLGYGGHSEALLQKLAPTGKLIAFDQDPIERPKTEARLRSRMRTLGIPETSLIVGGINFSEAKSFLKTHQFRKVNLVLADLGLSSMQMDDPSRGFSYKHEAPFDLRMNPQEGIPAWELLGKLNEEELINLLVENADEPHARQIAAALIKVKPRTTIAVTKVVSEVVKTFSRKIQAREGDTPIRRVFQALRIAVNNEFAALDQFLADLPFLLAPKGRVAILSFHSGEDRRVKKSFQAGERAGTYSSVSPELIRPSFEEQRSNSRSKSAKLRWAVRSN